MLLNIFLKRTSRTALRENVTLPPLQDLFSVLMGSGYFNEMSDWVNKLITIANLLIQYGEDINEKSSQSKICKQIKKLLETSFLFTTYSIRFSYNALHKLTNQLSELKTLSIETKENCEMETLLSQFSALPKIPRPVNANTKYRQRNFLSTDLQLFSNK